MDVRFRESRESLPRGKRAALQPCYIDHRWLSEHVGGATQAVPAVPKGISSACGSVGGLYTWVLWQTTRLPKRRAKPTPTIFSRLTDQFRPPPRIRSAEP